jgi:REP element-mobilizing transposase RayT
MKGRPYNNKMSHSKFDPQKHHRRSIRLPNYDYSQPGAYFITIVTWHRESLFGEIMNEEMKLSEAGQIVTWEWKALPRRFRYLELGAYVVMPNHFHGILIFHEHVGASRPDLINMRSGKEASPSVTRNGMEGSPLPSGTKPASLGAIIAQFKSRVTKRLWKLPSLKDSPIWQRNYYEHIIRNEKDLQNKTDYINANPMLWSQDDENPINIKL